MLSPSHDFAELPYDIILYILHEFCWLNATRFLCHALELPSDFSATQFVTGCQQAILDSDGEEQPFEEFNIMKYFCESNFIRLVWGKLGTSVMPLFVNFSFGSSRNADLLLSSSWGAMTQSDESLFDIFIRPWLRLLCGGFVRRLRFGGFVASDESALLSQQLCQFFISKCNDGKHNKLLLGLEELSCPVDPTHVAELVSKAQHGQHAKPGKKLALNFVRYPDKQNLQNILNAFSCARLQSSCEFIALDGFVQVPRQFLSSIVSRFSKLKAIRVALKTSHSEIKMPEYTLVQSRVLRQVVLDLKSSSDEDMDFCTGWLVSQLPTLKLFDAFLLDRNTTQCDTLLHQLSSQTMPSMESISLPKNRISSSQMSSSLASIASNWPNLRRLSLEASLNIDSNVVQVVATLQNLEYLNLDWCMVSATSITYILEKLSCLKTIIFGMENADSSLTTGLFETQQIPLAPQLEYIEINSAYDVCEKHHMQGLFPNLKKVRMIYDMFRSTSKLLLGHDSLRSLAVYSEQLAAECPLSDDEIEGLLRFNNLEELQLISVGVCSPAILRSILLGEAQLLSKLRWLALSMTTNDETIRLAHDIQSFVDEHDLSPAKLAISLEPGEEE